MTEQEWTPRMRSREEIEYLLNWLPTSYYNEKDWYKRQYVRSAMAVLRWILGQRPDAPITGRVLEQPIRWGAVGQESSAATEAIYDGGRSIRREIDQPTACGAETAAMWVLGDDTFALPEDWPWPDEAPPTQP